MTTPLISRTLPTLRVLLSSLGIGLLEAVRNAAKAGRRDRRGKCIGGLRALPAVLLHPPEAVVPAVPDLLDQTHLVVRRVEEGGAYMLEVLRGAGRADSDHAP